MIEDRSNIKGSIEHGLDALRQVPHSLNPLTRTPNIPALLDRNTQGPAGSFVVESGIAECPGALNDGLRLEVDHVRVTSGNHADAVQREDRCHLWPRRVFAGAALRESSKEKKIRRA